MVPPCPQRTKGERELSRPSFIRALIPFLKALPPWAKRLPKAPLLNTVPLGTRFGRMTLEEHKHPVCGSEKQKHFFPPWMALSWRLSSWHGGKESACQCSRRSRRRRCGFHPCIRKVPWGRKRQPTAVFLPGTFHRQRSFVGYRPWGSQKVRHD